MNSDFAADCARDAAYQVLDVPGRTDADRVQLVYLRLLGRLPERAEVSASLNLMDELSPSSSERNATVYRWSALIQALMISGEFRSLL